jgi:hypothetical protein
MFEKIFHKYLLIFLTSFCLLIIVGCNSLSPQPTPTPTPTHTPTPMVTGIEGRVYFSDNNEPIPDLLIRLNDPSDIGTKQSDFPALETRTNSEGYYSFTDINAGSNNLTLWFRSDSPPNAVKATPIGAYKIFPHVYDDNSFLCILEVAIDVKESDLVQEDFVVDR